MKGPLTGEWIGEGRGGCGTTPLEVNFGKENVFFGRNAFPSKTKYAPPSFYQYRILRMKWENYTPAE